MLKNDKTLIIAEAGVNHNGDIEIAKRLVDAAANSGADFVKFQTFSAKSLVTKNAPKADYQYRKGDGPKTQFSMLRELELSPISHQILIEHCQQQEISFLSTGFDVQSIDYLATLEPKFYKIPSGEITNQPYLRHVGKIGKPIIMSTGMANLGEIEDAIDVLEAVGVARSKITILHCSTEYPTPMKDVNLRSMCTIRDAFGVSVGYSDHTIGIEVPIAAVALGATIIEKHLTLDRELSGPDHKASQEPAEFLDMVRAIRNLEEAMGDGIKRPSESEAKNKLIVRKSLVAAKAIAAGEQFTPENVTAKRPGVGISPMRWDEVMGRVASQNFVADELIVL